MGIDIGFIKAQIKSFISVQDVFNRYCPSSKNFHGRYKCPFNHEEARYNFNIHGRSWKCFSCGISGDEIALVQKLFDLSPRDAMIKIATDFRLAPEVKDKDAERIKKEAEERQVQRLKDQKQAEILKDVQNKLYGYIIKQIRNLEEQKYNIEIAMPKDLERFALSDNCDKYIHTLSLLERYNLFADVLSEQPSKDADDYFCLAITRDELHTRAVKFIRLVYEGDIIL